MQETKITVKKMSADKIYTSAEVAEHKDSKSGVWLTIHGNVYDVTKFLEEVCDDQNGLNILALLYNMCFLILPLVASWRRGSLV